MARWSEEQSLAAAQSLQAVRGALLEVQAQAQKQKQNLNAQRCVYTFCSCVFGIINRLWVPTNLLSKTRSLLDKS